MRSRPIRTLALAAAVALSVVACGDDANDESDTSEPASTEAAATPTEAPEATIAGTTMAPEPTMAPDTTDAAATGTIVDVATDAGFTTLVAAVEAAGLVETLSGPGPFTVFAPTDEAFAAALESLGVTAEELLADTEKLTSILTYHVIAGEVPSSTVVTLDGQTATTVNGADVTISVDGEAVMVNDADVTQVDIPASNGIIHVIDSVLLPPA